MIKKTISILVLCFFLNVGVGLAEEHPISIYNGAKQVFKNAEKIKKGGDLISAIDEYNRALYMLKNIKHKYPTWDMMILVDIEAKKCKDALVELESDVKNDNFQHFKMLRKRSDLERDKLKDLLEENRKVLSQEREEKYQNMVLVNDLRSDLKELQIKFSNVFSEKSFIAKQVDNLRNSISVFENQNKFLQGELKEIKKSYDEARAINVQHLEKLSKIDSLKEQTKSLKDENISLLQKYNSLLKEKNNYEKRWDKVNGEQEELDLLRQENKQLERDLNKTTKEKDRFFSETQTLTEKIEKQRKLKHALEKENNFLNKELQHLNKDIKKARTASNQEILDENNQLRSSLVQLEKKFNEINLILNKKDRQVDYLKNKVETLEKGQISNKEMLKQDVAEVEVKYSKQLEEFKISIREKDAQIVSLNNTLQDKEVAFANLDNNIDVLREENKYLKTEKMGLNEKFNILQRDYNLLQIQKSNNTNTKIRQKEKEIKELNAELNKMVNQNKNYLLKHGKITKQNKELLAEVNVLKSSIKELSGGTAAQDAELNRILKEKENYALKNETLTNQNQQLITDNKELHNKVQGLVSKNAEHQKVYQKNEKFKTLIKQLNSEIDNLKTTLSSKDAEIKVANNMASNVKQKDITWANKTQDLEVQIMNLTKKLEDKDLLLKDHEVNAAEIKQENHQLARQNTMFLKENNRLEKNKTSIREHKAQIKKLTKELKEIKNNYAQDMQKMKQGFIQYKEDFNAKEKELQSQIHTLQKQTASKEAELKVVNDLVMGTKQNNVGLKTNINELQVQLNGKTAEIQQLTQQLSVLQTHKADLLKDKTDLTATRTTLESAKKDLETSLAAHKTQINELNKTLDTLKKKYAQDVSKLKQNHDKYTTGAKAQIKSLNEKIKSQANALAVQKTQIKVANASVTKNKTREYQFE